MSVFQTKICGDEVYANKDACSAYPSKGNEVSQLVALTGVTGPLALSVVYGQVSEKSWAFNLGAIASSAATATFIDADILDDRLVGLKEEVHIIVATIAGTILGSQLSVLPLAGGIKLRFAKLGAPLVVTETYSSFPVTLLVSKP